MKVKEDARINDVIEAAGGATNEVDLSSVNLAYIVEDGQKIYIPKKEDTKEVQNQNEGKEVISDNPGQNVIQEKKQNTGLVNINKTSLEGLKSLPGIRRIYSFKDT